MWQKKQLYTLFPNAAHLGQRDVLRAKRANPGQTPVDRLLQSGQARVTSVQRFREDTQDQTYLLRYIKPLR